MGWLELSGWAEFTGDEDDGVEGDELEFDDRPVLDDEVGDEASSVLMLRLEPELTAELDGARWLAQSGFEAVSVTVVLREAGSGPPLRDVVAAGPRLRVDFSCVIPAIITASPSEMANLLRPVVLEALELVGRREQLGRLPAKAEAVDLPSVPLRRRDAAAPQEDDRSGYFVITRDLPQDRRRNTSAVVDEYYRDFERLFRDDVRVVVVDDGPGPTDVIWVVEATPGDDES